ncbi:MAG: hypothetical protein JHC93_08690 [Parachlamydiales bacterium]|nr:hypothetical protein [Parachlamydiales bacterium]
MSNDNLVAILNCDEGVEKIKIEILDKVEGTSIWKFDYEEFIKALVKAKKRLIELNRTL